jgi:hypothetical protein
VNFINILFNINISENDNIYIKRFLIMGFRTKLDYSDNRQIKQRERSFTNLSGGTVFGVPFSALTTGVDPSNSAVTETYTTVVSTFSGNGTTTNFTWYDPRMDIANSSISAITSSNSGITQNTGNVFVVSSTGTTADGYNINLEYTGTSFDLAVNSMFSGAGPVYSGTVTHNEVDFLSAGTLDYKDRTIWIDNPEITRTNRLIVTNNPSVGYVLTCDSVEGEATWSPVSAATSGATFWEEDGTGNTALKDDKGGHTINGVSDNSIIAGGTSNIIDSTILGFVGGGSGLELYGSLTSSLLGGNTNVISGDSRYASIIGGRSNEINDASGYSSIIGGYNNLINDVSQYSSIIGGKGNNINGTIQSGLFAGTGNTITENATGLSSPIGSAIVGGKANTIIPLPGSVTPYSLNSGAWSVIAGGESNTISGHTSAFIGGGKNNLIDSDLGWNAIIAGGSNDLKAGYSAIIGGLSNTINYGSDRSVTIGGQNLDIGTTGGSDFTNDSVIAGGDNNNIYNNADKSFIGGGKGNNINGADESSIIGGLSNTITGSTANRSVIAGGWDNDIFDSKYTSIIGGYKSKIQSTSSYSTILGGYINELSGSEYTAIVGGRDSSGYTSDYGFMGGGLNNRLEGTTYSAIIGGRDNVITGDGSTNTMVIIASHNSNLLGTNWGFIAGSNDSTIYYAPRSVIVGGDDNTIANDGNTVFRSGIFAGSGNTITDGDQCAIIGGTGNVIDLSSGNDHSVIIGGEFNVISNADRSVILGGTNLTATADDTVYMNNLTVTQPGGILYSDMDNGAGALFALSGSSKLVRHQISVGTGGAGTGAGGSVGIRAWDDATYTVYGQPGDMHIYAGITSNGLNIISADGGAGTSGEDYIRFYAGQDASGTADMHIQGSGTTKGYVGIATESPTEELDINGELRIRTVGAGPGTTDLGVDATGVVVDQASDVNLKENIKTIENALDKVLNLRGVTYNWKDRERGGDDLRIGFIAQEVNEVEPILAYEGKSGFMGVHYKDFPALIVEAIKELANGNTPLTKKEELIFETQTIASEDNNIELNYGGTHESSLDGGLTVVKGIDENNDATLMIDSSGDWTTNTHLKPNGLVIPEFTPTSSNDNNGKIGEVTRDNEYLYIKTKNGWRRTGLETF